MPAACSVATVAESCTGNLAWTTRGLCHCGSKRRVGRKTDAQLDSQLRKRKIPTIVALDWGTAASPQATLTVTVRKSGCEADGLRYDFYFRWNKQCNLTTHTAQNQTCVPLVVHTCSGNVADLFPTYPLTTWLWIDSTRHSIPAAAPRWWVLNSEHAHTPGGLQSSDGETSRARPAAAVKGRTVGVVKWHRAGVVTRTVCLFLVAFGTTREESTAIDKGQTFYPFT